MDTTLTLQRPTLEKTATSAAAISILMVYMLTQIPTIFANDREICLYTGITPTIQYLAEQREKEIEFERIINQKYAGAKITNVEKGLNHIQMVRYYNGRPVRINLIELSTDVNSDLQVTPAIASKTLSSKTKITEIAQREHAIAAINGGYFKPQTGVPLGTLMIDKKIYTGPIYDRAALGIFDKSYDMARVQLNANLNTNAGVIKIDNINQPRMLSTNAIVYTSDWGKVSPPCPQYGKAIAVSDGKLVAQSYGQLEIPTDGFVIVAPEKLINSIIMADNFELDIKMNPNWEGVNHIISGGPYLVKNGEVYVDMTAQKLSAIGGRNPRTAIGYTRDNHLIMLTADGREGASVGLTLMELAGLMKEFGCVNAMNLDGGGSTVMYVGGSVVNKPAVQGGIPLSNTLTVSQKQYS